MAKSKEALLPSNEQILENLLEGLLDEVAVRNGLRQISRHHCAGCKGISKPIRACIQAREFLEKIRRERAA